MISSASTGDIPPAPQQVTLTLLLEGGHRETIVADLGDPLLEVLLQQLVAPGPQPRLLQVPVNGGEAMLAVRSDRIVAVRSTPPLQIEISGQSTDAAIEPSRLFLRDDFLPADLHARVLAHARAKAPRFVETSTSTRDRGYRQSEVLYEFPEIAAEFQRHLLAVLPEVQAALNCKPLSSHVELQMTAHNDGNYYRVHNDNGSPDTARRELTFVYYFHAQPKRFTGGELRVYDSMVREGRYVAAASSQLVEPRDNRIVFFASRYLHEVHEIRCPSRRFEDGRFTINGWIHKLD